MPLRNSIKRLLGGRSSRDPESSSEPETQISPRLARFLRLRPAGVTLTNPRVVGISYASSGRQPRGLTPDAFDGFRRLGTAYEYSHLPRGSFRLLNIITDVGDYPICSLQEYRLDQAPSYAAISYAWGKPDTTRTLFYSNPTSGGFQSLTISQHVADVLANLHAHVPRGYKIWIDAICIDQGNPDEKAHQIASMTHIYSHAEQVLCWLGPEAYDSGLAIDNLSSVGAYAAAGYPVEQCPTYRVLLAVCRLYTRPWFHRLWVVQETLMARELVLLCGGKGISWDKLWECSMHIRQAYFDVGFSSSMRRLYICGVNSVARLGSLRSQARGAVLHGLSPLDFVNTLLWARQKQVTEPVDRVWALLGLAQPGLQDAARCLVDYTEAGRSQFYKTYIAFSAAFLKQDRHLRLLSLAAIMPRHKNLPSWCPDFDFRANDHWAYGLMLGNHHHAGFSDAEPLEPQVHIWPAGNKIAIRGFYVDKVLTTRKFTVPDNFKASQQNRKNRRMLAWVNACLGDAISAYGHYETAFGAHCRTLVADAWAEDLGVPGEEEIAEMCLVYTLWCSWLADDVRVPRLGADSKAAIKVFDTLTQAVKERSYVTTVGGRTGLAPLGAKRGDCICILYGANTPYLVRKHGRSGQRLVGDAYIHGLMYGEALSTQAREMEGYLVIR